MTATQPTLAVAAALLGAVALYQAAPRAGAPSDDSTPSARLAPAEPVQLGAPVDSNSPAVWTLEEGQRLLHVFASSVEPRRLTGPTLADLGEAEPVEFPSRGAGGHWIESVLPDEDGTLYGFYHHEPDDVGCGFGQKTSPRIGMAVSRDHGQTWTDLGIVLRAPDLLCDTVNRYFVGGVGDLSVVLAPDHYVYVWFTSYPREPELQGVVAARLQWADRDRPRGRFEIWSDGAWRLTRAAGTGQVSLRASPIFPGEGSWHEDGAIRAFWGPSVHWNTYLERYVMLLNRSGDHLWNQEGVYVSYTATIDDPGSWSPPVRLVEGGRWYPQVIGGGVGVGTDRLAGKRARFFMSGHSDSMIVFTRH